MGKIPVGRTLSETLAFVFGRYLSLLGAVWLPLLILCVAYYFAFVPFIGGMIAMARKRPFTRMPQRRRLTSIRSRASTQSCGSCRWPLWPA